MAPKNYVLFEHAAGYSLFQVDEFEELAANLPELASTVNDLSKFNAAVKLVAFSPFQDQASALQNCNAVAEGQMTTDLEAFLDQNLPQKKRKKMTVGISDPKLATSVQEAMGVQAQSFSAIPELVRGIRKHFDKLVKGFSELGSRQAYLGVAHSYSRGKVQFNVNRQDNMIIQSINVLDQLDKDINTFCMRIKEWYSFHFPELAKIIPENHLYAKSVHIIGDRSDFNDEKVNTLTELLMDADRVSRVMDASKSSMGMDISELDLTNLQLFSKRVVRLVDYRKMQSEYLQKKMHTIAPNLCELIGEQVGARLICNAGSLTNLAKYPASTVQILGAEKALFRALKTRGNTPKYGLIFHSSFIGQAKTKDKGRISRFLANKCSIASRVDCFADIPTSVFGSHLKSQVEDRLKYLTTGTKPPKNDEIMKQACEEAETVRAKKLAKLERKRKKREAAESEATVETKVIDDAEVNNPKKKKKVKLVAEAIEA